MRTQEDHSGWESTLQLMRAARAGEGDCLRELVARFRGRLLACVERMMGPDAARAAAAEDFVQQAMVEAIVAVDKAPLCGERDLLGWLTRIARNNIRDEVRRRHEIAFAAFSSSVLVVRGRDGTTPTSAAMRREAEMRVEDALHRLPGDYRRVVLLRHIEGLPYARIAQEMGRSEKAVERLHARALVRLGDLLRDD